jgi:hypothetical protein
MERCRVKEVSTVNIVTELLWEMLPKNRVSVYSRPGSGNISVLLSSGVREIAVAHGDDVSIPMDHITIHIEKDRVKVYGKRGSYLTICDPDFEEKFKDAIKALIAKRVDFEGIKTAKEILEKYLDDFGFMEEKGK